MEESKVEEDYVYRISTPAEWEALQRDGFVYGGDLDKSTGCFHLSTLSQANSHPSPLIPTLFNETNDLASLIIW